MIVAQDNWWTNPSNVTMLGRKLVELGFDANNLQSYYEKPYNWTEEWNKLITTGLELQDIL